MAGQIGLNPIAGNTVARSTRALSAMKKFLITVHVWRTCAFHPTATKTFSIDEQPAKWLAAKKWKDVFTDDSYDGAVIRMVHEYDDEELVP